MSTKKSNIWPRVGLHATMLLLVVWSVLPFLWTFQTSIKFTRDVAAKEPVLWGYETTASAYRAFWLDDDDINMWGVGFYIVGAALVAAALAYIGKRATRSWPWYLGVAAVLGVALWRFPRIWEVNDEYDFLINSIVVTVLTMLISLCLLYTSPSPRDGLLSRMPSSA